MKTLIVYYSYSGNTKKLALKKAKKEDDCETYEILDKKRPIALKAYTAGCIAARSQKKAQIRAMKVNFEQYDKIIIMAPIWAGYPAPPINNVIDMLPPNKDIELIMVSGSGKSGGKNNVIEAVKNKGCNVKKYVDIKG